jgi:hypothetical protein
LLYQERSGARFGDGQQGAGVNSAQVVGKLWTVRQTNQKPAIARGGFQADKPIEGQLRHVHLNSFRDHMFNVSLSFAGYAVKRTSVTPVVKGAHPSAHQP